MSSEDQFTSIQWDRDDGENTNNTPTDTTIKSKSSKSKKSKKSSSKKKNGNKISPLSTTETSDADDTMKEVTDQLESTQINDDNHEVDDGNKEQNVDANQIGNSDEDPTNSLLLPVNPQPKEPQEEKEDLQQQSQQPQQQLTSIPQEPAPIQPPFNAVVNDESLSIQQQQQQQQQPTGYVDISYYEKYSIKTTVTHPNRDLDTASKPFISYLVTTTTDNPSILKLTKEKKPKQGEEYLTFSVRRRYGDFRYLYESLSNDFPTVMIPPLPSKLNFKYLTGDTFSSEFVHKRLHSLDRFIRFILQHKILSQLSIFHLFISNSNDWATFTTSLKLKDSSSDESGIVGRVVNEDLITETVMNFLTPSKHKKETNKDILEINDKLKKLYENLIKLDKIFTKLNKKNHELGNDYDQFLNQILKLSSVQKGEDSIMTTNFKIFSDSLNYFLKSYNEMYRYIDENFLISLQDLAKFCLRFIQLIKLKNDKSTDLAVLQDFLNKELANNLGGSGGSGSGGSGLHQPPNPVISSYQGGIVNNTTQLIKDTLSTSNTTISNTIKSDKIKNLEQEIAKETKILTDLTNKIINEEYPNWEKFNKIEIKNSMLGLCDQNIKFYNDLLEKFGEVEMKLIKRLDEDM